MTKIRNNTIENVEYDINWNEVEEQHKATEEYEDFERLVDREVRRVNDVITEHIPLNEIDYSSKANRHCTKEVSFRDTLFNLDVEYNVTVHCYKNNDVFVNCFRGNKFKCYFNSVSNIFHVTVSVIGKKMFLSSFTEDVAYRIKRGTCKAEASLFPDYYYELSEKDNKTALEQAVVDVLRYSSYLELEKYGNEVYCDFLTNCYIPLFNYMTCKSYDTYHEFRKEVALLEENGDSDELRNILSKLGYSYERIIGIGRAAKERMLKAVIYYSEKGIKEGPFYLEVVWWRTEQYIQQEFSRTRETQQLDV